MYHRMWIYKRFLIKLYSKATQAYRQLQKAGDFAGVESLGTHTMRKTFGYWFYKQTKDIAMLQEIMNHSTPQITLRYIGINKEEKDNVLDTFRI
ncbi:hypothetical protein KOY_05230 [Bacillus cereus VDM021]|nr:hypothetical protein KOY_05230 [Bacillus cereus VDM021]